MYLKQLRKAAIADGKRVKLAKQNMAKAIFPDITDEEKNNDITFFVSVYGVYGINCHANSHHTGSRRDFAGNAHLVRSYK